METDCKEMQCYKLSTVYRKITDIHSSEWVDNAEFTISLNFNQK